MIQDEHDPRLKDCLTTVQQLEEENRQLRRAATTFGKLAERLNEELGRDRRSSDSDRRRQRRDTVDRRGLTQPR
jgi:predicted RNase H-like nuclease (RuvC/YqgF family)